MSSNYIIVDSATFMVVGSGKNVIFFFAGTFGILPPPLVCTLSMRAIGHLEKEQPIGGTVQCIPVHSHCALNVKCSILYLCYIVIINLIFALSEP